MILRTEWSIVVLPLLVLGLVTACSQRPKSQSESSHPKSIQLPDNSRDLESDDTASTPKPISIHVPPYYASGGPKISVGEFSSALATQSAQELLATVTQMRDRWDGLSIEAMYVASIRLYDLGLKDESVSWFYSAQYRSRLFRGLLDPAESDSIGTAGFEHKQAHEAFRQLAGVYINGHADSDIKRLLTILEEVAADGKDLPNLNAVYPNVRFIHDGKWQEVNHEAAASLASVANLKRALMDSESPKIPDAACEMESNDTASARKSIPIHVAPYYNSEGPKISVGGFSTALSTQSAQELLATVTEMRDHWDGLSIEAMYVASIRLYDVDLKDESVYWFYSAQYRSRLFRGLLDPAESDSIGATGFEHKQAHQAFKSLAGVYINGYAFGDIQKLLATLEEVVTDAEDLPNLNAVYPDIKFIAAGKWQKVNHEVALGFAKLANFTRRNADWIRANRTQNNMNGEY